MSIAELQRATALEIAEHDPRGEFNFDESMEIPDEKVSARLVKAQIDELDYPRLESHRSGRELSHIRCRTLECFPLSISFSRYSQRGEILGDLENRKRKWQKKASADTTDGS